MATSFAFAIGYVWRPFSASGTLRVFDVKVQSSNIPHEIVGCGMLSDQLLGYNRIPLWYISFLERDDAKPGPKNE